MATSSRVKFLAYNILEEGTVTVTGEDAGYPSERLYDRSLAFYCLYTTPGAYIVAVSGNTLAVDTLIVEGHNLNGQTLNWQYSDNGSSWSDVVVGGDWVEAGGNYNQILKQLTTAVTHAWWRFTVANPTAFRATEIFMGRALSIPVIWDRQPTFSDADDIEWLRTYGGVDHSIRKGPKRKRRSYSLFMDRSSFPIASFRSDMEYLDDYSKPFYIIDHEDSCFLAKFDGGPPNEEHMNEGLLSANFSVLEIPYNV